MSSLLFTIYYSYIWFFIVYVIYVINISWSKIWRIFPSCRNWIALYGISTAVRKHFLMMCTVNWKLIDIRYTNSVEKFSFTKSDSPLKRIHRFRFLLRICCLFQVFLVSEENIPAAAVIEVARSCSSGRYFVSRLHTHVYAFSQSSLWRKHWSVRACRLEHDMEIEFAAVQYPSECEFTLKCTTGYRLDIPMYP